MRFQVIRSTVGYSSETQTSLNFSALPCGRGELNFSDGNRLVACDLSEKWGEALTLGSLYGGSPDWPHNYLEDGGKLPIPTTICLTTKAIEDIVKFKYPEQHRYAAGYAWYFSHEHQGQGLFIWLCVESDNFFNLLQMKADSPERLFFHIDVSGLKDEDIMYDPHSLAGTWDLDDISNCGDGKMRVVTQFGIERETAYFPRNLQNERLDASIGEFKKELEKIGRKINDLWRIEAGIEDGEVAKLLRLNLLAVAAVIAVGILVLVQLYF